LLGKLPGGGRRDNRSNLAGVNDGGVGREKTDSAALGGKKGVKYWETTTAL